MKKADELLGIAKLLGEENEKRLKDGIVDLLLQQVENDIEQKYKWEYSIDFDDMIESVKNEVESIVKEKMLAKYMEVVDKEFSEKVKL